MWNFQAASSSWAAWVQVDLLEGPYTYTYVQINRDGIFLVYTWHILCTLCIQIQFVIVRESVRANKRTTGNEIHVILVCV